MGKRREVAQANRKATATAKPARLPDPCVGRLGDLADWFGCPLNTLKSWLKAGCPAGRKGRWNCRKVAGWLVAQRRGDGGKELSDMEAAKLRREQARAELESIRLERMRGELIDIEEHQRQLRALLQLVGGALGRLSGETALALQGKALSYREARGLLAERVQAIQVDLLRQAGVSTDEIQEGDEGSGENQEGNSGGNSQGSTGESEQTARTAIHRRPARGVHADRAPAGEQDEPAD